MIEVPRGALTADEIAREADFFSFGTNDLTQMTFGYSRDDAEGGFLLKYVEDKILPVNPFQTLDDAVAGLMKIAVDKGRATKPDLELGICGEHGGDPESIAKCERIGLDYVSCSPFRVPVARLAAAQAALARRGARQVARRCDHDVSAPSLGRRCPRDRRRRRPRLAAARRDARGRSRTRTGWVAEEPEAPPPAASRGGDRTAGPPGSIGRRTGAGRHVRGRARLGRPGRAVAARAPSGAVRPHRNDRRDGHAASTSRPRRTAGRSRS